MFGVDVNQIALFADLPGIPYLKESQADRVCGCVSHSAGLRPFCPRATSDSLCSTLSPGAASDLRSGEAWVAKDQCVGDFVVPKLDGSSNYYGREKTNSCDGRQVHSEPVESPSSGPNSLSFSLIRMAIGSQLLRCCG